MTMDTPLKNQDNAFLICISAPISINLLIKASLEKNVRLSLKVTSKTKFYKLPAAVAPQIEDFFEIEKI